MFARHSVPPLPLGSTPFKIPDVAGSRTTLTADSEEALKELVEQWYERAAAQGLEDARIPWDPANVEKTADGYEVMVWAHS